MSRFTELVGQGAGNSFEEGISVTDFDEPLSTEQMTRIALKRAMALHSKEFAKRSKMEKERRILLSVAGTSLFVAAWMFSGVHFSLENPSYAQAQSISDVLSQSTDSSPVTRTDDSGLLSFERSRVQPVLDSIVPTQIVAPEVSTTTEPTKPSQTPAMDRYESNAAGTELSYYGEEMSLDEMLKAERRGQIPHSQNQGHYIGDPVPTRDERINAIIRERLPLNAQEQLYIKKLIDDQERIEYAMPDIEQRTVKFAYSDGEIPTITVAKSNLSTISFIDKYGNPFPISDISPKTAGDLFDAHLIDNDGTHANIAKIEGKTLNGTSNLSVTLMGRTLPALFKINMSQTLNDARVIVQLNNAAPGFEHVSLPESNSDAQLCKADINMEPILDGIVPASVEPLDTGIQNLQAFKTNEFHYIRSQHQIVDPDCDCLVYGVDNLNVCKQSNLIPNVLYVDRNTEQFQTLALASIGGGQ